MGVEAGSCACLLGPLNIFSCQADSVKITIVAPLLIALLLSCGSIPARTIEQKYAGGESRFLDVMGMRVHYRDEGTGPAIVLLHGMLSSLHTWDGWTAVLKNNYRVIRIDMPGFGLTGAPSDRFEYTADMMLVALDAIFAALRLDRFTLGGNSLGGYFSWRYAALHPERIERVILIDAVGYPQEVPGPISLMTAPMIGSLATVITPQFIVNHYIKQVYGDEKRLTPEVANRYYELLMREGNREACRKILLVMKAQAADPSLGSGIASLESNSIPVLVMWGARDTWVPPVLLERWKKDLPRARFVVFDDASHVLMEEIPERSVAEALEFLATTKAHGSE